jgi:hypothetical protein
VSIKTGSFVRSILIIGRSLNRIERKLRTHDYRNEQEFAADMRQMFTETYKYNDPDSPIVTAAGKLQKEFELRFAKIHFHDRTPIRPALLPPGMSEEDQVTAYFIFFEPHHLHET